MKHLDLFSGIGGFALATEKVWDNVEHVFCDNDPFSRAVLKKHWPNSIAYGEIRELTKKQFLADARSKELGRVSQKSWPQSSKIGQFHILTGGFPCQPFSQAGKRRGTEDDRYLWPEMLRVIQEFHPRWIIAENVSGLVTWSEGMVLEQVCADLENEGYQVQPFIIPACAVNAPHRRDRVWIVAYIENLRGGGRNGQKRSHEQDRELVTSKQRRHPAWGKSKGRISWDENWFAVATLLCTVDDGISDRLARPRGWRNAALKATGNAIVPQVATEIMKAMKKIDEKDVHSHS